MTESLHDGTIKFFVPAKDYGFIAPADGSKDVFFHRSVLVDLAEVAPGQRVRYILMPRTRIPQADRVVAGDDRASPDASPTGS